ncbi:MAG TPA: hypothetical protein VJT71_00020, partial [Pyrinomonadaceae bacterium]|nr:hypothetical protein [Pyrinomonadaceae bacterium]
MASSPYKFLDYYDIDEADSFFGRERETEILLSDVIATPLVLLFAKTGSGKTSLINAGVRPRLEELGYRTFYIRVERDPTRSAREALRQARLLPARIIKKSLDFQLIDTVRRLKRPIVLFFDQFEEFFLYIVNKSPEKARKFIANVAELYSNPDSGVHLVFSFREEFFVEMDAFREEIPTIFHNDSNLRLRWLDETQARLAITGPAKNVRLKIEEPLLERLLSDLSENGRVEPARLQIICDTLWRERARGRIRLAAYEKLGGATRILDWRLGQDINKALNDGQLELLRKLIPHLANTDRGTKYIRGLNELTESLGTTKESLRKLIDKLKGLHLVRESTRYEEVYVEWTSDYLAERTQYLEQRVHAISLRRMLTNGLERAKVERSRTTRSARRLEDRLWNLYLSPGEFDVISSNESLLGDLSSSEVEFLFAASLEHGARMDLWFQRAIQNKETRQKAWRILEDKIVNPEARAEQAENAVRLLGAQRTGAAMKLLKKALAQESLASTTISVLGEMRTKAAMKILQGALEREDLADQIINMLSGIRTFDSVQMLSLLLRDTKLGEDAERALERLSKVGVGKPSMLAKKTLDDWRLYQSRRARAESGAGSVGPTPRAEEFTGRSWGQSDWISLFHRIRDGYCTPFLGPRLGKDAISIHSNLAATLAEYSAYAGGDSHDFTRVAQFLSVKYDHR